MVKVAMKVIRRDSLIRKLAKLRERLWYVWHGRAHLHMSKQLFLHLLAFASGAQ